MIKHGVSLIIFAGLSVSVSAVEYSRLSCEGIENTPVEIRFEPGAGGNPAAMFRENGQWVEHKILSQDNQYIVIESQRDFALENTRYNQCFNIPLPACSYNYRFEREISPYASANTIYAARLATNRCSYSTDFDCKILERNQQIPHGTVTCTILEQ